MTEQEIQTCIKMGWDEGAIPAAERKMLARVFTLNDKTVGEVMVPREKMTIIRIDAPMDNIVQTVMKICYSRFPISKEKIWILSDRYI